MGNQMGEPRILRPEEQTVFTERDLRAVLQDTRDLGGVDEEGVDVLCFFER